MKDGGPRRGMMPTYTTCGTVRGKIRLEMCGRVVCGKRVPRADLGQVDVEPLGDAGSAAPEVDFDLWDDHGLDVLCRGVVE